MGCGENGCSGGCCGSCGSCGESGGGRELWVTPGEVELLERFGFACEDFGDGAVLVREVPADIDAADTAATLEELAEKYRSRRMG